jgi:hypothetical protein
MIANMSGGGGTVKAVTMTLKSAVNGYLFYTNAVGEAVRYDFPIGNAVVDDIRPGAAVYYYNVSKESPKISGDIEIIETLPSARGTMQAINIIGDFFVGE